ncbi:hypothetical protein Tco_1069969 [Tanacetum coccineum]|uniref:Reverse transcriptase/retrotransposon-derived protein RNase H-like domain-containing protein n=1 Tax=Tanacetum coccineum TaxID=301880 RepID=A0ABQ5HLW0_9ASTR
MNEYNHIKPINQKRQGLGPDRITSACKEVEELTKAGILQKVKHQTWVANPVMVKKNDGGWRMCVNLTDINKACPKDCYPLPEFGWKNDGATYQRLVDMVFYDQIGSNLEACVDNMAIKSTSEEDMLADIKETLERSLPFFKTLKSCTDKKNIQWTQEAEAALQEMKKFVVDLPMLTAPMQGEVLIMYLIASTEPYSQEGKESSAKDSITTQTCEFLKKDFNDFLTLYPIPSEYRVILPKSNQTVFEAPPRSEKHILNLLPKVITRIEGWHERFYYVQDFIIPVKYPQLLSGAKQLCIPKILQKRAFRNFIYTEDDKDLLFLPKEPSPGFGTGSPSVLNQSTEASESQRRQLVSLMSLSLKIATHSTRGPPTSKISVSNVAEKERLEAIEVSLCKEVEELKQDRREVVSKVIPYAVMELVYSDDIDPLAPIEVLLSEKPPSLQRSIPSRTQVPLPTS